MKRAVEIGAVPHVAIFINGVKVVERTGKNIDAIRAALSGLLAVPAPGQTALPANDPVVVA